MTDLGKKLIGLEQISNYLAVGKSLAGKLLKSGKISAYQKCNIWNSDTKSCDIYFNREFPAYRIQFTIDPDRKKWVDSKANELNMTRSDLMRLILDEAIKNM